MKKLSMLSLRGIWVLMMIVLCNKTQAQNAITGVVTDAGDGTGIPGATVLVEGTTTGTITDLDGNYTLNVANPEANLSFSFLGYNTQTVAINGRSVIDIQLEPDVKALEEVVVVGYGVQRKKEVTGSVSSVKSDIISQTATNDVNTSLQGVVAGVNVQASSGSPGASANIQIRGIGSFSASGSSPLYVVDGIPYANNPNLSPAEIASVDILKDGAAAAIYGTRASNGVVLITTKTGTADKLEVAINSYYGIQNITSGIPLMNNIEQIAFNEIVQRENFDAPTNDLTAFRGALDNNQDVVGSILNNNASIQNHNVTISGGGGKVTMSGVVDYFKQEGVITNTDYERISTRLNTKINTDRFTGFGSVSVRALRNTVEPWGLYQQAIVQSPFIPVARGNSSNVVVDLPQPRNIGNFSKTLINTDDRNSQDANGALSLQYEFFDGFSVLIRGGGNLTYYNREFYEPELQIFAQDGNIIGLASRDEANLQVTNNIATKWTVENLFNYKKTIGKHEFSALLGWSRERFTFEQSIFNKADFLNPFVRVPSGGLKNTSISGFKSATALAGYLGRITYNFDDKYLFSASLRRDGSSRFAPDNRFAVFPGLSFGWNISNENFYKSSGISNVLSELKLRGSWAQVGNQNIGDYLFTPQVVQGSNYIFGGEFSGAQISPGIIQRAFANPEVQWETNVSRNIGLDAYLFDNKLSIIVDAYLNDKQDMLLPVQLEPSVGTFIPQDFSSNGPRAVTRNSGNMTNKGIELAVNYKKDGEKIDWSAGLVFTRNVNEVSALPEGTGQFSLGGGNPVLFGNSGRNTTFIQEGRPVASFLLIPTDGILKTAEDVAAYNEALPGTSAVLGDLKYVDTNGDSTINDQDRIFKGVGIPDFEIGLNLNLSYKNFDFFGLVYFSYGAEIYNGSRAWAYQRGRHKDYVDQWYRGNTDSDIPAFRFNPAHPNTLPWSDYFLEDGTYVRVRNITVGYTLPKTIIGENLSKVRFYVSAQNPFTFTKYSGFDPEVGYEEFADPRGGGDNTLFNRGVDRGNYPISRRFIGGLQIEF